MSHDTLSFSPEICEGSCMPSVLTEDLMTKKAFYVKPYLLIPVSYGKFYLLIFQDYFHGLKYSYSDSNLLSLKFMYSLKHFFSIKDPFHIFTNHYITPVSCEVLEVPLNSFKSLRVEKAVQRMDKECLERWPTSKELSLHPRCHWRHPERSDV